MPLSVIVEYANEDEDAKIMRYLVSQIAVKTRWFSRGRCLYFSRAARVVPEKKMHHDDVTQPHLSFEALY